MSVFDGDDYARRAQQRKEAENVVRRTRALRIMSELKNSTVRHPICTFLWSGRNDGTTSLCTKGKQSLDNAFERHSPKMEWS